MSRRIEDLHVLLLQIRREERVRREEHESFSAYTGLALDQIEILDVFDRPTFPPDVADDYDALFIGGASEASVLEPDRYAFVGPAIELLLHCIERGHPVFASCFGFQLSVLALGGDIIRDERDFEMGTLPIRLCEASRRDPLFRDVPDGFPAVAVHKERARSTPSGCETLAFTDCCCHAFRVTGKPFWAFQFHPEVDRKRLVERLTVFKEQYTEGDDHLDEVLSSACETPESNALPRKFVERVLLGE
jgi:GMP synthase (glutamine-hydrolysing)